MRASRRSPTRSTTLASLAASTPARTRKPAAPSARRSAAMCGKLWLSRPSDLYSLYREAGEGWGEGVVLGLTLRRWRNQRAAVGHGDGEGLGLGRRHLRQDRRQAALAHAGDDVEQHRALHGFEDARGFLWLHRFVDGDQAAHIGLDGIVARSLGLLVFRLYLLHLLHLFGDLPLGRLQQGLAIVERLGARVQFVAALGELAQ